MDIGDALKDRRAEDGRLTDNSLELLQRCGLNNSRGKISSCFSREHAARRLLVRDDDIPDLVQEDVCDLGIVGLNVIEEARSAAQSRLRARCRGMQTSTSKSGLRCRSPSRNRRVQRTCIPRRKRIPRLSEHPRGSRAGFLPAGKIPRQQHGCAEFLTTPARVSASAVRAQVEVLNDLSGSRLMPGQGSNQQRG